MPKAEAGSVKHISNHMKLKGLTRLRFYCQACERGMRDENSFKQHTLSESHVRKMLIIGEDPKKAIKQFSDQFVKDFITLLKTSHGEKKIHINHFYQEYIANKDHLHMNSTQWSSLTEFAKYLGREGICRVEETDKGLHISWIDNSPEALRRQEALKRKAALEQGDEEMEQRMINEQIRRAQNTAAINRVTGQRTEEEEESRHELKRQEGTKISLSFGPKKDDVSEEKPKEKRKETSTEIPTPSLSSQADADVATNPAQPAEKLVKPPAFGGMSLKLGGSAKPKNVFAQKKNALGGSGKKTMVEAPKKMSEAERIMKQELERKRAREGPGNEPTKKMKFSF
ncbi:KIN17-like protein [Ceratocystis lukuohia]|uniref:KIN17-like protein n=1 Tax=Ceratocystis lukuohia TaxID=2019550 RepID=A0ABR4MMR5_9PEZI